MPVPSDEFAALTDGARSLGLSLGHEQASKLIGFLDVLYFWNRTLGLTKVVREDAVRLHLLDSLSVSPLLATGTVADLGTGAGLPGVPLAVLRPEVSFYLVESSRRRCSFLAEALRGLDLSNVVVLESDVESLIRSGRQFDTVVGRAFRPPTEFLEIARRLLPLGGRAVVMRGGLSASSLGASEMLDLLFEVEEERRLNLPSGGESRSLLALRRVA